MQLSQRQQLYLFGVMGLIASVGVGVGEFLLHYSPNGLGYEGDNFQFFNYISSSRLTLGHFIAIGFTPFYFVGYYHFYLIFKDNNPISAWVLLVLGIVSFAIGGMWISSRAQLGYLVHVVNEYPSNLALQSLIQVYRDHAEILVKFLRLWIAGISIVYFIPIIRKRTIYPRWMAFVNPLLLLLLILLIYQLLPSVGYLIGPIAMNVAHFILFSTSLIIIKYSPS